MNTKIWVYIFMMLLCASCHTESKKVQNIETFARLYGYVRWFHPSDEAQQIDWDKFAALGIQKVENIKSDGELRDTLLRLFSPIVPGLQLYRAGEQEVSGTILKPSGSSGKITAWQHLGGYFGEMSNNYRSVRANIRNSGEGANSELGKAFMNIEPWRGKKVHLSGYFRTDSAASGSKAILYILTFSNPYHVSDRQMIQLEIDSRDWKKYDLELVVPRQTVGLTYGVRLEGGAGVWGDEFGFRIENGNQWEPVDTVDMGFESGKLDTISNGWHFSSGMHEWEVTDDDAFAGRYCLKASYKDQLFEQLPKAGEVIREPIGNGLVCVVPLTLQTDGHTTFPETGPDALHRLQSVVNNAGERNDVASVIILWNVLQHFFPYFDEIDEDWEEILRETLEKVLTNQDNLTVTLSRMLANLCDGHGVVFGRDMHHLPVRTEFIEGEIVVTASLDTSLEKGDIIKTMDGKPSVEVLKETEKTVSGSPQLRRYRALNVLGSKYQPGNTDLVIERDGKLRGVSIANDYTGKTIFFNPVKEFPSDEKIIEIEDSIYYINMSNCSLSDIESMGNNLSGARSVIYDCRNGFAFLLSNLIPHLTSVPVRSVKAYQSRIIYPDHKKMVFIPDDWTIMPKHPELTSQNIFITDPSLVSNADLGIGVICYYGLGKTVGAGTAGCMGAINGIDLPCGYQVWWTGMKVLKHDGSRSYISGYEPDYPVEKTIRAVREARDEYLEKALEVARNKLD